jgi:hypothetical protein
MTYYVAHAYSGDKQNIRAARQTLLELQKKDLMNFYVCPVVAIPALESADVDKDSKLELCIDLMTLCDAFIIGSYISEGMKKEIEFARLIKMEVLRLGKDGKLRPFSE